MWTHVKVFVPQGVGQSVYDGAPSIGSKPLCAVQACCEGEGPVCGLGDCRHCQRMLPHRMTAFLNISECSWELLTIPTIMMDGVISRHVQFNIHVCIDYTSRIQVHRHTFYVQSMVDGRLPRQKC